MPNPTPKINLRQQIREEERLGRVGKIREDEEALRSSLLEELKRELLSDEAVDAAIAAYWANDDVSPWSARPEMRDALKAALSSLASEGGERAEVSQLQANSKQVQNLDYEGELRGLLAAIDSHEGDMANTLSVDFLELRDINSRLYEATRSARFLLDQGAVEEFRMTETFQLFARGQDDEEPQLRSTSALPGALVEEAERLARASLPVGVFSVWVQGEDGRVLFAAGQKAADLGRTGRRGRACRGGRAGGDA